MSRAYRGKYPLRINMVVYTPAIGWTVQLNNGAIHKPDAKAVVKAFPVHGLKLNMEWPDVCAAMDAATAKEQGAQDAAKAMKYVTKADQSAVLATIQAVLSAGYAVRIFDGEERVYQGTDASAAIATMGSTGSDGVAVLADGQRVGTFSLIYGMSEAEETVADYSWAGGSAKAEATMNRLYRHIMGRLGRSA